MCWGQPLARAKLSLVTNEEVELIPDGKGLPCLFLESRSIVCECGKLRDPARGSCCRLQGGGMTLHSSLIGAKIVILQK